MSDFYLVLHSDASAHTFPDNRPGHFKSVLREEINLGNIEYKVGIAGITRYHETSLEDLTFIREKRQAPTATPGLEIAPKYQVSAKKLTLMPCMPNIFRALMPSLWIQRHLTRIS